MARNEACRNWVIERLKEEGVPEEKWERVDEQGRTFLRMPRSEIKIIKTHDPYTIAAYLYAREEGDSYWAHWEDYLVSDLPNDLISLDDLKRFGIDAVNIQSGGGE